MNKTIQQLKKQAEDYAGRYGVTNNVYGQDLIDVLDQKFAELIVAKCVDVGMQAWLNDNGIVPTFPGRQMRAYFGDAKDES